MKKITYILTLAILVFSLGCKKDNDKQNQTRMELITTGQWKIIALTQVPGYDIDGDGDLDTDIFQDFDICEKDDYYIFKSNGIFDVNEGPSKCDASDPQVVSGSWSFANQEKEIILDGTQGTIEELSSTRLRMRFVEQGETTIVTMGR
ncbi:MAG TPA: DUF5004 domain-containing protein [Chitinophagaceae bacterium]|nr:DUF5004 domain-containing protein [Chitinophagaceae bacterium]